MATAIQTDKLTKFYGKERGIVDLDLEVEEGAVFGFLGPNGAGKTTTLRLLLDLIRPTRGSARVLRLDPRRDGVRLRRRIGYVPGELALYGKLSGAENLRYFASLRGGVEWSWVEQLAERLDCDLSRRVHSLSTGNRHKVALLQAFMHRPALLIFDEPTAGLDPLVQHVFYRLCLEAQQAGQTVLLSSHLLPEVQEVCGRAAFVRDGRLIAVEDVRALGARSMREVEIVFAGPAPAAAFSTLAGVSDVTTEGDTLRFRMRGRFDPVVKTAAAHEVLSLRSTEPDLEDVFMAYYGAPHRGLRGDAG